MRVVQDEVPKQKPRRKNMQRSAPPPPRAEEEEEDLPVFKKEKNRVQRAAGPFSVTIPGHCKPRFLTTPYTGPPAAAAPPPPERKVEIRTKAVEVDKLELVPSEREVVTFDVVNTTRSIDTVTYASGPMVHARVLFFMSMLESRDYHEH
jgi:hypothetical protein